MQIDGQLRIYLGHGFTHGGQRRIQVDIGYSNHSSGRSLSTTYSVADLSQLNMAVEMWCRNLCFRLTEEIERRLIESGVTLQPGDRSASEIAALNMRMADMMAVIGRIATSVADIPRSQPSSPLPPAPWTITNAGGKKISGGECACPGDDYNGHEIGCPRWKP